MKKIINHISLLLMLFVFLCSANAQRIYKGQIAVNSCELNQKGDSLRVNMELDFSDLELDANRSLTLVPLVIADRLERELPSVVINGNRRHKIYQRQQLSAGGNTSSGVYAVVKAGDAGNKVYYSLSVPFEKWMSDAHLDMKEDLCGCGGATQRVTQSHLADAVTLEDTRIAPTPTGKPLLSFIRPEVEELKKRSEQKEAFLDFPVAKSEIIPSYMNNPRELNKIESMLSELREDKNLTVQLIAIKGFASPEGSVSLNSRLSYNRAEAMRAYLSSRSSFPYKVYQVEQGGEDWEGLERLVSDSYISYKEDILYTIRSGRPEDAREQALKSIGGGEPYRVMLRDLFPQLRRVVCRVEYTVRGFDVDEAREIIRKNPKQLSLDEMFLVANTYDMQDPQFAEVFETAVRMYPDNEIANLNAAASSLQLGDLARAKKYLDNASSSTGEYLNNLGVYYLLKGEYRTARDLFTRAARKNVVEATDNLNLLEQKLGSDAFNNSK